MADEQNVSQVLPSAPPPPQEVKVRTLKSDLASIAASGGGLPRYANVNIARTPAEQQKSNSGPAVTIAVIVLAAVVVAIAIYFVNQLVLKK
jgi:hypothetical protein